MTCKNGRRAEDVGGNDKPVNKFDAGPFDRARFLQQLRVGHGGLNLPGKIAFAVVAIAATLGFAAVQHASASPPL